jgi:glycosyltransferase involved in cell wall biosynthesis
MGTGLFSAVEVAGVARPGLSEVQPLTSGVTIRRFEGASERAGLLAKTRATGTFSRAVRRHYRHRQISLVNCHSLTVLPLCWRLASDTGAGLVYDPHELETESQYQAAIRRPLAKVVEAALIRRADHTFVVNEGIADWYRSRYPGLQVDALYNYPSRAELDFDAVDGYFHKRFGLTDDTVVFLYLGLFAHGRGIETLIQAFDLARDKNWALVLMGYGPMQEALTKSAETRTNVFVHPAVPTEHVVGYARQADIGLQMGGGEKDDSLSYQLSSPNKLFQYLAAGIPVIASDIAEQRRILQSHRGGVLCPSTPDAIVAAANQILSSPPPAVDATQWQYTWEQYDPLIKQTYERILSRNDHGGGTGHRRGHAPKSRSAGTHRPDADPAHADRLRGLHQEDPQL